jgi:thiol-disulfide isomerase/thioredoxin
LTTDSQPEDSRPPANGSGGAFWALLALLVAAAATLVVLQARRPHPNSREHLALPLPPLEVGGWINTKKSLTPDDLRDKVVLVDFWASDCGACVEEIPALIKLHQLYRDQGFTIVGLSREGGRRAEHLKSIVETRDGLDWPIGYDANFVYDAMGVNGTPTYVLYGRAGRSIWSGHSLYGLEDAIVAALAKK